MPTKCTGRHTKAPRSLGDDGSIRSIAATPASGNAEAGLGGIRDIGDRATSTPRRPHRRKAVLQRLFEDAQPARESDPVAMAIARETGDVVMCFFATLRDSQQELVRRTLEGEKPRDIAGQDEGRRQSVRKALNDIRKRLRAFLARPFTSRKSTEKQRT